MGLASFVDRERLRCPAWGDGNHLFVPGFIANEWINPFRSARYFRTIEMDDHKTDAKACRCGKVVMAVGELQVRRL